MPNRLEADDALFFTATSPLPEGVVAPTEPSGVSTATCVSGVRSLINVSVSVLQRPAKSVLAPSDDGGPVKGSAALWPEPPVCEYTRPAAPATTITHAIAGHVFRLVLFLCAGRWLLRAGPTTWGSSVRCHDGGTHAYGSSYNVGEDGDVGVGNDVGGCSAGPGRPSGSPHLSS